jgi:hypothetical protein
MTRGFETQLFEAACKMLCQQGLAMNLNMFSLAICMRRHQFLKGPNHSEQMSWSIPFSRWLKTKSKPAGACMEFNIFGLAFLLCRRHNRKNSNRF